MLHKFVCGFGILHLTVVAFLMALIQSRAIVVYVGSPAMVVNCWKVKPAVRSSTDGAVIVVIVGIIIVTFKVIVIIINILYYYIRS